MHRLIIDHEKCIACTVQQAYIRNLLSVVERKEILGEIDYSHPSLSVGFTHKERALPKIGMRNVPHLDLCGENPSHLLLGRFHGNA